MPHSHQILNTRAQTSNRSTDWQLYHYISRFSFLETWFYLELHSPFFFCATLRFAQLANWDAWQLGQPWRRESTWMENPRLSKYRLLLVLQAATRRSLNLVWTLWRESSCAILFQGNLAFLSVTLLPLVSWAWAHYLAHWVRTLSKPSFSRMLPSAAHLLVGWVVGKYSGFKFDVHDAQKGCWIVWLKNAL